MFILYSGLGDNAIHPSLLAPREYHTQYYVVEVQTLVELNPNILVRDVERMAHVATYWHL